jgi:hypothetical protein
MGAESHREGGSGLRWVPFGVAGLGRIGLLHAENLPGRVTSPDLVRVVDADETLARATGFAAAIRDRSASGA